MDIQSKFKQMYERASKKSFTSRFYKQIGDRAVGASGYDSHGHYDSDEDGFDARFKQVEWFSHKNAQEPPTQGGVIELDAPMLQARSASKQVEPPGLQVSAQLYPNSVEVSNASNPRRSSSRSRKLPTTHHLHQATDIMESLQKKGVVANSDINIRSTKIVCTLGHQTNNEEAITKMIRKGMNVARINMNYFEIHEQNEIIQNIRKSAQKELKDVSIMVDLKGPLIRTLGFKEKTYSIKVNSGQEIRISTNRLWKGDQNLFIVDYENLADKLIVGDKVLIDYGGIVLTVIGFETEEKYLVNQERKRKFQEMLGHSQASPPQNETKPQYQEESKCSPARFASDQPHFQKQHTYSQDNEDLYLRQRKDELIIDEELVENEDEEDRSDILSSNSQNKEGGGDKSVSYFPPSSRIDTQSHHQHKVLAEELESEQLIFNEVLKKSSGGFTTTSKINKLNDLLARSKKNFRDDFSSSTDLVQQSHFAQTNQSASLTPKQTVFDTQYKVVTRSKGEIAGAISGNEEENQNIRKKSVIQKLPSKDYFNRKRASREEYIKNPRISMSNQQSNTSSGGSIMNRFNRMNSRKQSQSPTNSSSNRMYHQGNAFIQGVNHQDNLSLGQDKNFSDVDSTSNQANHQSTQVFHNYPAVLDQPLYDLSHPLIEKERRLVICRVENDGEIKENKPIYIPGLDWQKDLKLSVLGPNDVKVLHNSINQGVNMIAVSCVESKDDIFYVRKVLGTKGQHIKILAKLQSQKALENFDSILEESDGIVIARGYLSLSLDLEDVVYVQKYIIKKCNTVGKPVLLSTQILESMVTQLIPSRSEVVDISNAVYDGIDALILSPETASGVFYEQATETMSQICLEAERHINYQKRYHDQQRLLRMHLINAKEATPQAQWKLLWGTEDSISSCAVKASFDVKASLIIVFTHSGLTARKVAKHKPKCPIISVTPNEWAAKGILIHRGVYSLVVGSLIGQDTLTSKVLEHAVEKGFTKSGDYVVITSGLSGTVGSTNLLKIIKV